MPDCAATTAPLSSPAPSAHRCAAAGLDSATAAEHLASTPSTAQWIACSGVTRRMRSGGDQPHRLLRTVRSSRPLACFRSVCNSTLADWTDDHLNHPQPYTAGRPENSTTSGDANRGHPHHHRAEDLIADVE